MFEGDYHITLVHHYPKCSLFSCLKKL